MSKCDRFRWDVQPVLWLTFSLFPGFLVTIGDRLLCKCAGCPIDSFTGLFALTPSAAPQRTNKNLHIQLMCREKLWRDDLWTWAAGGTFVSSGWGLPMSTGHPRWDLAWWTSHIYGTSSICIAAEASLVSTICGGKAGFVVHNWQDMLVQGEERWGKGCCVGAVVVYGYRKYTCIKTISMYAKQIEAMMLMPMMKTVDILPPTWVFVGSSQG